MRKVLVVLLIVVVAGVVLGQEGGVETVACNTDWYTNVTQAMHDFVDQMDVALEEGDLDSWLTNLYTLRLIAGIQSAYCYGYSFDHERNEMGKVIGPFILAEGTYIAHVSSDNYFRAKLTDVSGLCMQILPSFNLGSEPVDDQQDVFKVLNDCDVVLEVDGEATEWEFYIEPIS